MTDVLADNYRKAYDGKLGFGARPALILVDFVAAYFDPECALFADVDSELQSALRLLATARTAGVPIVFTNVVYHADGADGGVFYRKVAVLESFLEGNPLGAWATGIEPRDGELVVSKQYPSAFFGTSLASTLATQEIDTLIITGLTTSGCVRATCVDAMCHGFVPIVVADACGDRHSEPHEANLFDMNAKYADVVDEAAAQSYLQGLG